MFVADKVLVSVGFDDAKARLGSLARGDGLAGASEAAYSGGMTGLVWPGTPESTPAGLRLAKVRSHDLVDSEDCAGLALRWEAIAPGGGLFPALDADIKLTKTGARPRRPARRRAARAVTGRRWAAREPAGRQSRGGRTHDHGSRGWRRQAAEEPV